MKKSNKIWLTAAVAVIVIGGGFYLVNSGKGDIPTYRVEKVDRGDLLVAISATGTLSADTTVLVGSQVSGRIAKLYADFNSTVKKGALLAQLDPTFLQAALDQAKAGVARAVATLNQAERDYNRTKDLFAKSLVASADMDAATASFESAKAGLQQAQAGLDGAEVNLRYATIYSPISGVVISRNVDVGQTVAASLSAPTLFEIANDLRKMQVQASVDEADIGNVKVGQDVTFRVDAYPLEEFKGTVRQIRLAPIVSQNVVTYNVIINTSNPNLKLMPGMTATVSIIVADKDDVLRVPLQATKFTPPDADRTQATRGRGQRDSIKAGGRQSREGLDDGQQGWGAKRMMVWVLEKGKPAPRMIRPGIQDARYVEVMESKLNEGDEVIIGLNSADPSSSRQANNPFAPQMPGGRGRRGGM